MYEIHFSLQLLARVFGLFHVRQGNSLWEKSLTLNPDGITDSVSCPIVHFASIGVATCVPLSISLIASIKRYSDVHAGRIPDYRFSGSEIEAVCMRG